MSSNSVTSFNKILPYLILFSREGHASIVDEIVDELQSKPDLIVASVGGGGLALGILRGTFLLSLSL